METWKTAKLDGKRYEYYEVSDCGRVRSLDRKVKHNYGGYKTVKGRVLRINTSNPHGYCTVVFSVDNTQRTCLVHRVVSETFLGSLSGKEVNHKDGNKQNNNINNLEIVTKSENILHSRRVLRKCIGEGGSNAKLSLREVEEIKEELKVNQKRGIQQKLAERYGVTKYTISDIKRNKTWKN